MQVGVAPDEFRSAVRKALEPSGTTDEFIFSSEIKGRTEPSPNSSFV